MQTARIDQFGIGIRDLSTSMRWRRDRRQELPYPAAMRDNGAQW
jgi:hypothetical protein